MKKINLAVVTLLSAAVLLNGCAAFQNMSKTGKGATIGGASGAAAGRNCFPSSYLLAASKKEISERLEVFT